MNLVHITADVLSEHAERHRDEGHVLLVRGVFRQRLHQQAHVKNDSRCVGVIPVTISK